MNNIPMIKILLIEDDEDDFIITRDFLDDLSDQQYHLDWARNQAEAREFFQQDVHDVCLLDYSLGAHTGLQLMAEAQQLGFSAPTIMLTGHDDSELDADALSAGAVDYLVKSQLSPARLNRVIRYAVARKGMEQERLKRIQAQAENRSKSEFLAHLSHELRTPLTAILGYTDLLSVQTEEIQTRDYVNIIRRNGNYLLSLLNDVLDLSKIEAGKLDTHLEPVNINELLSNIFNLMNVKAGEKNIEFVIESAQNIPEIFIADATRLQQILINIIGNAIKFTDAGKVCVRVEATLINDQCALSFHIEDTGIGIESSQLARLFKPFEQIRSSAQRGELGTGLGLAISQQLAERLGGHIRASSEAGVGSQFTLELLGALPDATDWLPLSIQAEHAAPEPALTEINASILIVDDLEEIRNLLGHIISRYGANVEFAQNGLEAIALAKAARGRGNDFDLILMDMQMPMMDGLEATRQLRSQNFQQPIIALTAQTMLGEKERCLAAGCDEHLGKPILERHLISAIQRHLPLPAPQTRRLLLVEDNADARNATQLLLQNLGWIVTSCSDTSSAMRCLREDAFDLIVTDINLPDGDGISLAKTIRGQCESSPPIVAVTGQDIQLGPHSPFSQILLKPLSLAQLAELDSL